MNKLCQDIAEGKNGFSFGESWRYSEDSLVALLPILRTSSKKRGYLLLRESDKVETSDTGNINKIGIYNGDKLPVFIRTGEIFTGKSQERMAIRSYLIMPKEKVQIEVKCVYASKGINTGATMTSGGIVPTSFNGSTMSASFKGESVNQGDIWRNVQNFTMACSARVDDLKQTGLPNTDINPRVFETEILATDDLKSTIDTFGKVVEKILQKVPYFENQVGIATLDLKGVNGIECFDLKESWKALRDDIIKKEGENLSKEQKESPFEYKKGKGKKVVRDVLLLDFEERPIFKSKDYRITSIKKDDYVGEIVEFENRLLHLLIVKK